MDLEGVVKDAAEPLNPEVKSRQTAGEGGGEGRGKGHSVGGLDMCGGVPWLLSAEQLEMGAEQSRGVRSTADKPGGLHKARVLSLSERRGPSEGPVEKSRERGRKFGGDHPPGDTEGARGPARSWPASVTACFLSSTFPVLQNPLVLLFIYIEKDSSPRIIVGFTRILLIRETWTLFLVIATRKCSIDETREENFK